MLHWKEHYQTAARFVGMTQMIKVFGWDVDAKTENQNATTVHIGCTSGVLVCTIKQKKHWQRSLSTVRDTEKRKDKKGKEHSKSR